MPKTNWTTIRRAARLARAVLPGATVLLLVGQPAPAAAQIGCGGQVGPDETVTLEADLSCSGGGPALTVVGPATLDLNGHGIGCQNPNDGGTGITVLGERARIRNGLVVNCFVGVIVSGAGNHVVEHVVVRETCDSSFVVAGASGNRFTENVARAAGGAQGCTVGSAFGQNGFTINGSQNVLDGNVALLPDEDGFHVTGEQNQLKGNAVAFPGNDGFEITTTASDNRMIDNLAFFGSGDGFEVDGSGNRLGKNIAAGFDEGFDVDGTGNTLRLNRAIGNGDVGYDVSGAENELKRNAAFGNGTGFSIVADRSRLTRNTALGNDFAGKLVDGDDNQIRRGTALGNDLDLADSSSNCGTNQWKRNTFQTSADLNGSNPPCIE